MIPERPKQIGFHQFILMQTKNKTRRVWPHEFVLSRVHMISQREIRRWCNESLAGEFVIKTNTTVSPIKGKTIRNAYIVRIQEFEDAVLFKLRFADYR